MLLLVLIVTLGVVTGTEQDECRGILPLPTEKCNEYMLIHHGKPYIYECPDGLLFDKNRLMCDLPENTECLETNKCIQYGIECPNVDSDYPVYRPLPNCTEFCECSNGVPYLHHCPEGLHWNPSLNACDFPERAGCITTTTTSAPTTTSLAPETTTAKSDEDAGTEICLKEGAECPIVDSHYPVYTPLQNCTEFCECANGVPYLQHCPGGLHWNPVLNVCDWPERAGCEIRTTTEKATTYHPATTDSWENDCHKEHIVCPKYEGKKVEYYPLSNCEDFCLCYKGEAIQQHCPLGLHFNPVLHVCESPETAGCQNRTTRPPYRTTTEPAPITWVPKTESPEDGSRICRSQGVECPIVDPATPVYHAVSHCRQFCECSNGTPFLFDCPAGTLFNEKLDVCDWPYNVYCSV